MLLCRTGVAFAVVAVIALAARSSHAIDQPGKKWDNHVGMIPFVLGYETGMAEVQFSGKPAMILVSKTFSGPGGRLGRGP